MIASVMLATTTALGPGWVLCVVAVGVLASHRLAVALLDARAARDTRAGRYDRAVSWYLRRGRLVDAAHAEERRGDLHRAAALLSSADEVEAAALMIIRHGRQKYGTQYFTHPEHLDQAAAVFLREGQMAYAAELYEQAGRKDRAIEIWEDIGEADRAAAVMVETGAGDKATKLLAEAAMAKKDFATAGPLWEELGQEKKAGKAYVAAGDFISAARMAVKLERPDEAARLLVRGGRFLEAAPLFARSGLWLDAASAAYRGGDVPKCLEHLERTGDRVAMAHALLNYGRREEAKERLRAANPDEPDWSRCREVLAAVELEDGRDHSALAAYGELVDQHLEGHHGPHEALCRWMLRRVELLILHGRLELARFELERCGAHGLLTPSLVARAEDLSGWIAEGQPHLQTLSSSDYQELLLEWADAAGSLMLPSIDRYEVHYKLAHNASGEVFYAGDRMLDHPVALKWIAPDALPSERACERFIAAAQQASRLEHPNIGGVYDMGTAGGRAFLAREYVEGDTLAGRYAEQLPLPARMVAPVFKQLCDAVTFAHEAGVVHGNIKPDTVRVTPKGKVKLMDFGINRALDNPDRTHIDLGGSPAFMSPEQIAGSPVDQRTDVYSLGVLLFQLVTGNLPYRSGNIIEQHRAAPVPDARSFVPDLPEECHRTIGKAMAKAPEDRFQSARDFADAVLAFA